MHLVLVHGAWHKGECWEKIHAYLNDFNAFQSVLMPNLPARALDTPNYQKINRKTQVRFLCDSIKNLEGPVFLVGHSLAGITITEVAEHIPHKISGMIYLTAFIAKDNESMFDLTEQVENAKLGTELIFKPQDNMIDIRKSDLVRSLLYNKCAINLANEAMAQLCPEPFKVFAEKAHFKDESVLNIPKYYIQCTEDMALKLEDQKKMSQQWPMRQIYSLDADHSPFLSAPKALALLLKQITQDV